MTRWTLLLCLGACAPDSTPERTAATVWLEPDGAEGVTGWVAWHVFGPGWSRAASPGDYLCTVDVQVSGTPSGTACPDCAAAWDVEETGQVTDCDDVQIPTVLQLTAVGIGSLEDTLLGEDPWPRASQGSWIRQDGSTWEPHGWVLDSTADQPATWQGDAAVTLWPGWSYDLVAPTTP